MVKPRVGTDFAYKRGAAKTGSVRRAPTLPAKHMWLSGAKQALSFFQIALKLYTVVYKSVAFVATTVLL